MLRDASRHTERFLCGLLPALLAMTIAPLGAYGQQLEPRDPRPDEGGERSPGDRDDPIRLRPDDSRGKMLRAVGFTDEHFIDEGESFLGLLDDDIDPDATPFRPGFEWFSPHERPTQAQREDALVRAVAPSVLRNYHELLAKQPHPAGSPGDLRVIRELEGLFTDMGLAVEVQWLSVLLPRPIDAAVEIVEAEGLDAPLALSIREPVVRTDGADAADGGEAPAGEETNDAGGAATEPAEDDPRDDEGVGFGWNAWSASGDVTAPVVYANYATRADFEQLNELGVEVEGAVVIARYGRVYRGVKAELAEEAGAAALILYTDPSDAGGEHGDRWPQGGWPNEHAIQRGSILPLDTLGDPSSPTFASLAVIDAPRLEREEMDLPNIVVQPIGWGAAREILSRMTGGAAPENFRGAIPGVEYRLTGGDELRVRVMVEQELARTVTANVLARLNAAPTGDARNPIIVGAHHDAWTHGASDPTAGLICVVELARVLGERARGGDRPVRPIVFAAWGAEEHGLIGATEYVQANVSRLEKRGVAYINLDMAAMGPNFSASASPELSDAVIDATRNIRHMNSEDTTVFAQWDARVRGDGEDDERDERPLTRVPGGGSDHLPFMTLAGMPVVTLGAWGAEGAAYHSAYDTVEWYQQTVGSDYQSAAMVTRVAAVLTSRLGHAAVAPLDHSDLYGRVIEEIDALADKARANDASVGMGPLGPEQLTKIARSAQDAAASFRDVVHAKIERPSLTRGERQIITRHLAGMSRRWLHTSPPNPFFRNAFIGIDPDTGYGSRVLPLFHMAIESPDRFSELTDSAVRSTVRALARPTRLYDRLIEDIEQFQPLTPLGWNSPLSRLPRVGEATR
jgi:N-acetylated-alpha-linked acidic dipeptidase